MERRLCIYLCACLLSVSPYLSAQRVLYCEPYSDRFTIREELAGKVGDYYWIEAISRKKPVRHGGSRYVSEERTFDVYDTRMNLVNVINEIPYPGSLLKEYLVSGNDHFDKINLLASGKKVMIWLQRYDPDGQTPDNGRSVGEFPFYEPGNSFLMIRSEDRSRILLLGFEFQSSGPPRIHALQFDQDWQLLSSHVYRNSHFSQPAIQDDFTGYPLEDFNNGPVKLANNGEWLMMAPSRTNSNFLLFHFSAVDTSIVSKEIMLPGTSEMEDVNLSINNERGEAVAGVLSTFHYEVLKNVQVIHYTMSTRSYDFDSSYRLNTVGYGRVKNGNLVRENFISVPGRGFMLLKEYGRPFEDWFDEDSYDEGWDPTTLFAANSIPDPGTGPSPDKLGASVARQGYARYRSMGQPSTHERGDLSLYYFPAGRGDSCWSGMISKEQVTELNSPNLSYFVVPMKDRLFFLYNSFVKNENLYATTTVVDNKGKLVSDQGILFWRLRNTLAFQQSRQLSADEVVIPYDKLGRVGFAVIMFGN